MWRGSLVTLIYNKTLSVSTSTIADAEAITLMSADIDRIGFSMEILHEAYACLIELGIALWLLWRLIGLAVVAPILWVCRKTSFICSYMYQELTFTEFVWLELFLLQRPQATHRSLGWRQSKDAWPSPPKSSGQ